MQETVMYEAKNLYKRYGSRAALKGVNFAVSSGKLVGLPGPNGNGKTTLLKISAGLLTATGGCVLIGGRQPGVYTKCITSYLPDRMALPTEMRAADAVDLYADFYTDFDAVKARAMLADLHIEAKAARQIEIEIKYEGYIQKARRDARHLRAMDQMKIPQDIDYAQMAHLSLEARQKLNEIRPMTLGQASRISGLNPADIAVLAMALQKKD